MGHLSKEDFMKTHPRKTMVFLAPLFLAIPEERWLSKQSGIRATGIDPAWILNDAGIEAGKNQDPNPSRVSLGLVEK